MSKYTIISLVIMCLLQSGCSLAPAAANRSQKAFDSGEYKESLRLTNRALTTYEYSVEGEANLWILKVDNYIQLKQYSHAYAALRYIIQTYTNTEAFYRAEPLLVSIGKVIEKTPDVKVTEPYTQTKLVMEQRLSDAQVTKKRLATPNNNLTLVNMNIHPIVMIETLKVHEQGKYQGEWIDFEFELKAGKYSFLKPSNIVLINSSVPENTALIHKAEAALKKWVYNNDELQNYQSKRYALRISSNSGQKFEGYQCNAVSCIKIE